MSSCGAVRQALREGMPARCRFYAVAECVCSVNCGTSLPSSSSSYCPPSFVLGLFCSCRGRMVNVCVFWRVCLCLRWMWSVQRRWTDAWQAARGCVSRHRGGTAHTCDIRVRFCAPARLRAALWSIYSPQLVHTFRKSHRPLASCNSEPMDTRRHNSGHTGLPTSPHFRLDSLSVRLEFPSVGRIS